MRELLKCLVYNPASWKSVALAVAGVRAGGLGVICAAHDGEAELAGAFKEALGFVSDSKLLGMRLNVRTICSANPSRLASLLTPRPGFLVITGVFAGVEPALLSEDIIAELRQQPLIWEIADISEFALVRAIAPRIDGWILSSNEAGGRAGTMAAPLFLQKALQLGVSEPIVIRGGFGIIGAAGLVAAGATGVVLDDQVLLLKESPLHSDQEAFLSYLSGLECALVGEAYGAGYRFLHRPEFPAARQLTERFRELEASDMHGTDIAKAWHEQMHHSLGWRLNDQSVWPAGQAVGLAAPMAKEFVTVARLVQAIVRELPKLIRKAAASPPFSPNAPLAVSHGTKYPIVQGPMTRVSDNASFAAEVARAGALPLLALALTRGDAVKKLLSDTVQQVGNLPWGVGILGFVPELSAEQIKTVRHVVSPADMSEGKWRAEQMEAIRSARPPFVLISGGTSEQVKEFESEGIPAYLHVSAPSLLQVFLRQGVRRFVLEGRESGGHIGPLGSLMLWEHSVRILLKELPPAELQKTHVLFAGGIHDARSAALVSLFAAPLAERGIRTGILMGSAYIFTREAVSSGAIVESFQHQISKCTGTATLEAGGGYMERCAATQFVDEFQQYRRQMLQRGAPADLIRWELELVGLGRLRLATKGLERNEAGELVRVDEPKQIAKGMYMIGEVATLSHQIIPMKALHEAVAEESGKILRDHAASARIEAGGEVFNPAPADIAVIGMSCILPGSQDAEQFWTNLLAQKSFIREIPKNRFDWRMFYDPDKQAKDKSYSKWGGFVDDVPLDPLVFGIPPNTLQSISPTQLLTLECVRRALEHAGLGHMNFDRENTEVIIGIGQAGGFFADLLGARSTFPQLWGEMPAEAEEMLPPWTGESFTGLMGNITAGRIANRFDFGGANFTVDAACAASLAALDSAIKDLETHRCNLAIAGGTDCLNSPFFYLAFSKTQALSPDGRVRTFDKKANGIVISEGTAVVVLKRLKDAERDGDKIYGVIKSVAGSSDGKELGLTAPRSPGQVRVLQRAYRKAGFGPDTIEFYEAHGTGTALGDRTEVESIVTFLKKFGTRRANCVISSHKTLIGHTKEVAGVAGVIKSLMALSHRTLPPHAGVDEPLQPITEPDSPVALLDAPRPWLSNHRTPRRCGVSGFGFGGINFHAILEEYQGTVDRPAPGGQHWPYELLLIRAKDKAELVSNVDAATAACERARSILSLAAQLQKGWDKGEGGPACAIVVSSLKDARIKLSAAREFLINGSRLPADTFYSDADNPLNQGKVALLFPGQGSQYVGMLREPAVYFEDLRAALEQSDAQLLEPLGQRLSDRIYPVQAFDEAGKKQQADGLKATGYSQPALATISAGLLRLLRRAGLSPQMYGGHSFGEICALHAAGVISETDLVRFSEKRGRLMSAAGGSGAMAAVAAELDVVKTLVGEVQGITLANINSPKQSVISGARDAVLHAIEECKRRGLNAVLLPVGGAFHSPAVEQAAEPLVAAIRQLNLSQPACPVYSNETAEPYPSDMAGLRTRMETHLVKPVQFMAMIRRMHDDGARIFVEVGANRVLQGLVNQCLGNRAHCVVSLDDGSGRLSPVLFGIGVLACLGVIKRPGFLWEKRISEGPDMQPIQNSEPAATDWFVNGMYVWSRKDPHYGKKPLHDLENAAQAVADRVAHQKTLPTATGAVPPPSPIPAPAVGDAVVATYAAYQETMRQFLRTQEQIVSAFLGAQPASPMSSLVPKEGSGMISRPPSEIAPRAIPQKAVVPNAPEIPLPEPVKPAAEVVAALPTTGLQSNPISTSTMPSRQQIIELLIKTVSAETGYPSDMLGLDRDIEADLGIDSIKRMEILNAFQPQLPAELVQRLAAQPERMEVLSRAKTLNLIAEQISQAAEQPGGDAVAVTVQAEAETPTEPAPAQIQVSEKTNPKATGFAVPISADGGAQSIKACPRFVMQAVSEPAPKIEGRLGGLFLITPDNLGLAALLAKKLSAAGAVTHVLTAEELRADLPAVVAKARAAYGPVMGIVHFASQSNDSELPPTLEAWRESALTRVKMLFELVKACYSDLSAPNHLPPRRVMAVSRMGGVFGREEKRVCADPISSACLGFLKTLETEVPTVLTRMIDLDPALEMEQNCEFVFDELVRSGGRVEVGYPQGKRTVFNVVQDELPASHTSSSRGIPDDAVILATGGATGITAEILKQLARPGMKLILAGRSALTSEPAETAGLKSLEELRRHFILTAQREGRVESPASIERGINEILRARTRQSTIAALRARGSTVEYISADVTNEAAVRSLLDHVYAEYGRIDVVFHGAGVIADKFLADKTRASFDEVFDTKADSAYLIARHLRPETLKHLFFFGSMSSRFGNQGQSDYSAANELLNGMAWRLHQKWPDCHVVCINWGPWAEIGMVASAALNRRLTGQGITPIATGVGCDFVARELERGRASDIEVIAGDGTWNPKHVFPLVGMFDVVRLLVP